MTVTNYKYYKTKFLRLQTGLPYDYPTKDLIKKTGQLSVHQMIAYHTLLQVHKVIINNRPKYLSDKMKIKSATDSTFPHRQAFTINVSNKSLSISRAGFVFRGS